jgi:hypothetical protein
MPRVRKIGDVGARTNGAFEIKKEIRRLLVQRENSMREMSLSGAPVREVTPKAMPSQVKYWTTHGYKHGIIVEVGVRPFGRKKVVWVSVDDVKPEA